MTCPKCGSEFNGNFCSNCGTAAPRAVVCVKCGSEFEGNFCPNCGHCSTPAPSLDEICHNMYDKNDNYIDVDKLAGVYLSVSELRGYFKRNTIFNHEEIEALSKYIAENIAGDNLGIFAAASEKAKFEAPGKAAAQPSPSNTARQAPVSKPLSKRERIKENKQNGVACCPKCGSTSLSANKKGFGFVKGGIGATIGAATNVGAIIGLGAGNIGGKKLWVTCLNCGHKWKK